MKVTPPRVLLTNDDGPPGPESPYLFAFSLYLTRQLGWDVKVVIPSSQKSWIGKAFHIKEVVNGKYYYPREQDGTGEVSDTSRPLRGGEVAEWILLDGTPATCANVALHNLYPGQIDLVISGPNLGRNTSGAPHLIHLSVQHADLIAPLAMLAAFALSSGTIGAALSASLSRTRAIALSYGTFLHPTPTALHAPAHRLAGAIVSQLWHHWGADSGGLRAGEVDLYNVNIPMIERLLAEDGVRVAWTTMWRNSYGRLFKQDSPASTRATPNKEQMVLPSAGPDSPDVDVSITEDIDPQSAVTPPASQPLVFRFAPDIQHLIQPPSSTLLKGTDTWAIHHDMATVSPLRASFAEPPVGNGVASDETPGVWQWKMKL